MKIKHIYVNHKDETFAILSAAQAMDLMFSTGENIECCGDHTGGIFYLDENDKRIEYFRDNEWVTFESYHQRLNTLKDVYTDVTDFFEEIEE